MIDLELTKKDILRYVQDLRAVRAMGRGLSYHHVVLCKVRLVGARIRRREGVNGPRRIRKREGVNGPRRIRSEKLREH